MPPRDRTASWSRAGRGIAGRSAANSCTEQAESRILFLEWNHGTARRHRALPGRALQCAFIAPSNTQRQKSKSHFLYPTTAVQGALECAVAKHCKASQGATQEKMRNPESYLLSGATVLHRILEHCEVEHCKASSSAFCTECGVWNAVS